MPSLSYARATRWWNGEGAIRLEEGNVPLGDEKGGLPSHNIRRGGNPEQEGYTQTRLLFECVVASIWNGLCLVYLLAFPHLDPITSEILSPRPHFVYVLLALVTLPLVIGMCAGADAMSENLARKGSSRTKNCAVACGFLACCGGIWTIVGYVVREQAWWLQLDLGLTTLCLQALLLRAVHQPVDDDSIDELKDQLDIYEFLRETRTVESSETVTTIDFAVEASESFP
ncbi:hypothetical protein JCM11491_000622 [Sporobolomyces phaffii]